MANLITDRPERKPAKASKRSELREKLDAIKKANKASKKKAAKKVVATKRARKQISASAGEGLQRRQFTGSRRAGEPVGGFAKKVVLNSLRLPKLGSLTKAAGLPSEFGHDDLLRRARQGVSIHVIDALREWAPSTVINHAIAPATTLSRWRRQDQPLTGNAADSTLRLVSIIAQAEQAFGDAEKARRWLAKPTRRLDSDQPGITPFELMESEHGARLVEERLTQIAHGHFA
jgi:putative toxin-antitoxin system antitoxin component (TIGR02293 family)